MSKSSAITLGYKRKADPLLFRLSSGRLEYAYKCVLWIICQWLPLIALVFWLREREVYPLTYLAVAHWPWLLVVLLSALLLGSWRWLRAPFNGATATLFLRKNEAGYWLGSHSEWQPLALCGEQLIAPWVVVLGVRSQVDERHYTLWLWADGDNADAHRQLRVALNQGR
ncbi:protein YgfX [Simiduia aestuariiviva]|uniref:Toxin CptA n=1 Tax=Simiduia aestuariiviva TaxID=1510459 RepID=A0A839UP17_9GAMM|nr:protein YgfX [Simiduia aestuariiviva]MBB3168259.1 hypothetical protein [Simiduia aestuariiviva]